MHNMMIEFLRYKEGYGSMGYGRPRLLVNPAHVSAVVEDGKIPNKTVIRLTDGRKGFEVFGTYKEVLTQLGLEPRPEVVIQEPYQPHQVTVR